MLVGLLPYIIPLLFILFFPWFQDFYDTGRWVAMIVVTLYILLVYGITLIKTKKIHPHLPPLSIGFGALTLASILSVLLASTNKIEALVHPLGVVTYGCLFILTLLLPSLLTKEQKDRMIWATIVIIGSIGLVTIYQQFAITSILFPNAAYLQSTLWNPTGTPISALVLFMLGIPLAIYVIRSSFTHHKEKLAAVGIVSGVFMLVGLVITTWRFIPLIPTVIMPIGVGWTTLLETLKSGKTALVGIGAENFLPAYALGRPLAINQTALWNTGFSTSATIFLHIATTIGLVGVASLVILIISWLQLLPKAFELRIVWILTVLAIMFFPPSIPLLIFMAIVAVATKETIHTQQEIGTGAAVGICICIIGVTIASFVGLYHFTKGELLYATAGIAVEKENNLTKAYTNHILAIKQNQFMTRYHVSLSQLSLVMGGSILSTAPKNEATGEVTLLDEDKSLVTSLFSLAVSEAKLATTLAPNSYVTWTNLATIYQSLIGVANDASTWTIAAYQKAITLNPISPTLRIDFGGIYMNAKDYDNAITQFATAAALKPDYANAYYNLANAYRLKGDTINTLEALKQTQALLSETSVDYQKISDEINNVQLKTPETIPTTSNQQ